MALKRRSILFVEPDYHCSFMYRKELRRLGWKVDIYANQNYPPNLLYSKHQVLKIPVFGKIKILSTALTLLYKLFFVLYISLRYKYHICYGGLDHFYLYEKELRLNKIFGDSFRLYLFLAKLLGVKFIFSPSGCLQFETKQNFSLLDDSNVCNNCGWSDNVCNDNQNIKFFEIIRRYSDINIAQDIVNYSTQFKDTPMKYKSLDLDKWKPDLKIPKKYLLPKTNNLRILHSFFDKDRDYGNKNIKGSPYIIDAINQLADEGFPVEYFYLNDIHSSEIIYYQLQADIIVEQLIYGWWGSTGVETLSLGKPVICYLRPEWKNSFLDFYKEYYKLPIIESNTQSIYAVLKKLVSDKELRVRKSQESRIFAEQHFDVKKNSQSLSKILTRL